MTLSTAYRVEQATLDDLPAIARIHVLSWQQAYRRSVPQEYLDSLDVAVRQKEWENEFRAGPAQKRHLYVAKHQNETIGFISFGPGRDKGKESLAEIYAVYLLVGAWGAGAGHALFQTAMRISSEQGYSQAYVWVMDTNENAILSYRHWGGIRAPNETKQDQIGGQPITEIMLSFDLGKK